MQSDNEDATENIHITDMDENEIKIDTLITLRSL